MKILYVVTAAGFGGAPAHVLQLMEHMRARGHEVALCSAPEPRLFQAAADLGAAVFPNPHFVRRPSVRHDVRALAPVARAMRQFMPDLVHAHSTKAGFAARLCAAALGFRRVVFTSHGWAFNDAEGRWSKKLYEWSERCAARWTTRIICVSEYHRVLALQRRVGRPEKLTVIHNGVDAAHFTHADGERIRKEFALRGGSVVVTVSRLAPPKDIMTLIRAAALLPDACRVLIVGGGELRPNAEQAIRELHLDGKVVLTGDRSDIPEILAASDVFVLSSLSEGLPITIIEAMMSALPVVATEVGGVAELVNEQVGILVPPGDSGALAAKLRLLLSDADLRRRLGEAGRRRAFEQFTSASMLEATERLYNEIAAGGA